MSSTTSTPTQPTSHPRVKVIRNPNYKRDAMDAYGQILKKYNIKPFLPGPFTMVDELVHGGEHVLTQLRWNYNEDSSTQKPVAQRKLMQKSTQSKSGLVEAKDVSQDTEYLCPVSWSSELDKDVKTAGKNSGHRIYNHAASHTFKNTPGSTWNITYGDGSGASGTVGTDDVTIGGVTIHCQSIELANKLSKSFQTSEGDGLLGLAWSKINTVRPRQVPTPVDKMISQHSIPSENELFTAYLGGWKDLGDPDQGKSFYTFGFIDQDTVKSTGQEVYYTPIDNSKGFWQFPSASYSVNGVRKERQYNTAIADTGTTLAIMEDNVVRDIYSKIPGAQYEEQVGGYIFPGSIPTAQLPVIKVDVGGKMFQIQKEDLSFAEVGNGYVFGGIQGRGDLPFDILGGTFLKGSYCIFDVGRKRFGLVQRSDPDDFQSATQRSAAQKPVAPPSAPNAAAPNPKSGK